MKKNWKIIWVISCCLLLQCFSSGVFGQEKLSNDTYLIRFTDKHHNTYSLSSSENFLSSRALSRRTHQQISITASDLPVSLWYIDSLKRMGFEVVHASKWLNAVSVKVSNPDLFDKLTGISFILPSAPVKNNLKQTSKYGKFLSESQNKFDDPGIPYGNAYPQIFMHHGDFLHAQGFRGQGMLIAVIDAGFNNATEMSSLDSLWSEDRVKLIRDIIIPGGNVFIQHQHGADVLSILAGDSPGKMMGSAPKAEYLLLRSEDATPDQDGSGREREYPVEEFNWAVAAELADSLGADIISTSLGYSEFNDPSLNHRYSDMNGKTTLAAKAASMAASKGMIVVVSAGNEGDNSWKYITTPADADSVLTIGAIDVNKNIAGFSSRGPTSDHRIKPDVVAVGRNTFLQLPNSQYIYGNGTSFSAPIIAGLTACLWQSCPSRSNMEIIRAIRNYASQSTNPDTVMGYGIPDFRIAMLALNPDLFKHRDQLICSPNPFSGKVELMFDKIPGGKAQLQVVDAMGRKVWESQYQVNAEIPNVIEISDLATLPRGIYIIKLSGGQKELKIQVIKIER